MCFTVGEVSSLETNEAGTNMSVTKPPEQPWQDSNIGQSVHDASAAPAFKSKIEPEEDLLEGIPFVCMCVFLFFCCCFLLAKTFIIHILAFFFRWRGFVSSDGSANRCKADGSAGGEATKSRW